MFSGGENEAGGKEEESVRLPLLPKRPAQRSSLQKAEEMTERKVWTNWNLGDLFLALIVAVAYAVLVFAVTPFNRGFFCNDESIKKPYVKNQKVPTSMAGVIGAILPILAILLCEGLNFKYLSKSFQCNVDQANIQMFGTCKIKAWIHRTLARIFYFVFGIIVNLFITELGKVMVGRLRPHFLAVCEPDYSKFNCSQGFITMNYCTGDKKHILEARKSFPSGHSSYSAYTMVFLALYLQYVLVTESFKLFKPVLQIIFVTLAIACSLTRISDYFHHWSDVLSGLILGTLVAFFVVNLVMRLNENERIIQEARRRCRIDVETGESGGMIQPSTSIDNDSNSKQLPMADVE